MPTAYLAGPIQDKKDYGTEWRKGLTPRLLELGIKSIDPTRDKALIDALGKSGSIEERILALTKAKTEGDWETVKKIMHIIWVYNKQWVDESDFLIVHCAVGDEMVGTVREMHEANEYKKPIFLVLDGDPFRANSHLLSMVLERGRIFQNFDGLLAYLKSEVADNPLFKKNHIDLFQVSQKLFIKNDRNELLILKSSHGWFYDVPGGRMDYKEFEMPFLVSLKREVEEELGGQAIFDIHPEPVTFARVKLWDKQLNQYHYRRVFMVFYEADYKGGEMILSHEHELIQWVSIAEFNPTGLFKPGMEQTISSYLARKHAAHL